MSPNGHHLLPVNEETSRYPVCRQHFSRSEDCRGPFVAQVLLLSFVRRLYIIHAYVGSIFIINLLVLYNKWFSYWYIFQQLEECDNAFLLQKLKFHQKLFSMLSLQCIYKTEYRDSCVHDKMVSKRDTMGFAISRQPRYIGDNRDMTRQR